MSIVRVDEEIQPLKYLVITQEKDPESVVTTNIVISDNRLNKISLVSIEKGSKGDTGAQGPRGLPGQDGVSFDVLPITSGGTNNTSFGSGNIIYYDGNRLSSSQYTLDDIANGIGNGAAVTGVFAGSGLSREISQNSVTLNADVGEGLFINGSNQIAVDDTIVRKVELNLGSIDGVVPISKGGTNNQTFNSNRLLYYDGFKISSFPLATGRLLLSGTTIDIIAGSGLTGGGSLSIPSGSVVLNIGESSDILVENNSISLSATGNAGTYTKITTDIKGRVVSGSNLTYSDIINILGYTPWHAGNDGADSGLDADLLDGLNSDYFLNLANQTGIISPDSLPVQTTPGLFTKVQVNDKGIVVNGQDNNYFDIVNALGYRPVCATGDTINGPLIVNGDVDLNSNILNIRDNLPTFGTNTSSILPSEPRGFSFLYGGYTQRTGILAFYPAEKELRLITNISSTGEINGGPGDDAFRDDIDGGNADAVYVVGGLTGDMNVVLLRAVADSLYVSRINAQTISGSKTFAQPLTVNNQITIVPSVNQNTPPFNVASNTGMVDNLNVDLLHGHNGDYYTNAENMTGLFDYAKVQFNNLEGTPGYLAIFDSRTTNPSRTVSDSYIQQTGNFVRVTNNFNLSVGNNSGNLANRSAAIGVNNQILGNNSLAVGNSNLIQSNNSVALNYGSKTFSDSSIAAGTYGYSWSTNQFSFGAFADFEGTSQISQGQYSTIALGLNRNETNGSWISMSPVINIPKDKTIAYSLEVLINKAPGPNAALTIFSSGIIKNSTYRDPNNLSSTLNTTSILRYPNKTEIYNDSQQRRHFYHYRLDSNTIIQNLEVTAPPLKTFSEVVQNTEPVYKFIPQFITANGSYSKTNDGLMILDINKPISSGWGIQNSGSPRINIKSYYHGMATGCLANIIFTSGSHHRPVSQAYEVVQIIDKNNFVINENSWRGYLTGNQIIIDPDDVDRFNNSNKFTINGGYVYTNSPDIYNIPSNILGIVQAGMKVSFGPYPWLYGNLTQTGIITNVTSNTVTMDTAFTGVQYTPGPSTINSPGFMTFENYSEHVLGSPTLYLNIDGYGQQPIFSLSGAYPIQYCNRQTIGIKVSGIAPIFSGISVRVSPAITNTTCLTVNPKRNIDATYSRSAALFTKYNGIYTIYPSISGTSNISIYNKQLDDIRLPSVPFVYSFCCGYGDTDNSLFEIQKVGINNYLKFKNTPMVVNNTGDGYLYSSVPIVLNKEYIFGPTAPSPFEINTAYYGIPANSALVPDGFQLAKSFSGEPIIPDSPAQPTSYLLWPNLLDYEDKKKYSVRIKATDKSGRSIEQSFGININDINENPYLLNPIPDQNAFVDELFYFTIPNNTFKDVDFQDSVTYSSSLANSNPLPPWLSFNSISGSFSGVPAISDTGILNIKVIASDTGSLYIEDNFSINVANNIQSLGYLTTISQTQQLRQINLDNNYIEENSYDGTIGKLDVDGGYKPYFIFDSCSNSFRSTMINGSKALTECFQRSLSYPTTTIYGSISSLVSGLSLTSTSAGFPNGSTIDRIISPVSFSAIVTSGSNNISITDSNLENILFSGIRLFSSLSGWDNQNVRAQSVTPTGITINLPFVGAYENPVSCLLHTSGNTIVLSAAATETSYNVEAVHSVSIPSSGQYYVDYLKTFNTIETSGWCPTDYTVINTKGFDTQTREYVQSTGYYGTGTISFYTDYGFNRIDILSSSDINIEPDENSIYLNYVDSNNGIVPTDGPYSNISGDNFINTFLVDNTCLFPDIVPASTGSVKINLDQNHGYQIVNPTIINQVPIKFTSTINNNSNRIPKNNLFNIVGITGNKITVTDSQNYLLKENNRPDYFEQAIRASYSTNGFAFTGTFINNSYKIFDLTLANNASPVWTSQYILEPNNLIGSTNQQLPAGSRFVDFQNGFYFNGLIGKNQNIISYCDNLPGTIYPNAVMSVFNNTIPGWPSQGIEINFSGLNTTPYRLIEYSNSISFYGNGTQQSPFTISCGAPHNEAQLNAKLLLMGCDAQEIKFSGSVSCRAGSFLSITRFSPTQNYSDVLFSFGNPYSDPANFNQDGTQNDRIIGSDVNISITGWPKDTFIISTSKEGGSGPTEHANFNISSYVLYSENAAKYKLELNNSVPSFGGDSLATTFYVKPVMTLTEKTCLDGATKSRNNQLFFNGSIIRINNLSTPRSYLNKSDQIKFVNFNNNINFSPAFISQYAQIVGTGINNTSITGIITNGPKIIPPKHSNPDDPYKGNEFRFADSFGLAYNQELPNSGSLAFLGAVSGYCTMPYFNNIYYHSYGGIPASWPADIDGKYLSAPTTGVYSISPNLSSCASGTMCLSIRGFSNTIINNVPDSVNRSNIGKTSNISKTTDSFGYTRPWGTDKKLYFDFSDGAPELNGSYYIADKIDPQTITLNIPYNSGYLNRSGLVMLVDSNFNMKSNRNPNIDNTFYASNGFLTVSGTNNSLFDFSIDSYNDQSKRWKHLIHLNNYSNTFYSGYNASIQNQVGTQLLYLNPDVVQIYSIEYSFDFGYSYTSALEDNTISLKSTDTQTIYLKVKIKDGASRWANTISKSAPKINIFGISDYTIDSDNILYNYSDRTWTINIIVNSFVSILQNRNITITASDETGTHSKNIALEIFKRPKIVSPVPDYVYENDIENWSLTYYIDNLPNPPNITMDNFPSNNYTILNEQFTNSNNIKIVTGPPGSNTGIFNPILYVRDYITNEILASHTGIINVIPANTSKPTYSLSPVKLDDNIHLNITNNGTASFDFYIPAINASQTNLIVTLSNDNNYSYVVIPEYSTVSNTYKVTVQITGLTGYYPNKNISISLNQPQPNSSGDIDWINYTFNKTINLTLYKNLEINTFELIQPLLYDKEEQWSIQFRLKDGILSHRSDTQPKVRLSNLPTIGTYENQPLEYSISYQYDDINKRWHVTAIGKKDVFGNNTDSLGLKTIQIYAEDGISSATNTVNILFSETRYLDNIQPTIFATENQPYQSTIDIKQAPSSNVPNVSIPDSLRENTISLNRYYNRYDKDLKTWEFSYLGDNITDKWDVQLVYNNINNALSSSQKSSITVQCKGIATDKIQAIGKLSLIELDSVSLTSLPIQISNITFPYYSALEGSPWEITFSTVFGLENPNFPPTILLSGLPSVCSGYNPKLPLEQQSSCLVFRTWDAGGKKWNFSFKGLPLCGIEGLKPFTITAIDTDTIQNTYLTADTKPASILYTSLTDNGNVHPAPDIKFMGENEANPVQLYPQCNSPMSPVSYRFGPASRTVCPIPTGITGWIVSGVNNYDLLPPGINYTITFPGGNPAPPWNNLSSGILTIYGNPTTFAGGGQYPQELNLIVFDARNKSTKKTIKFVDASAANPPSPMDITVYFDREKPSYTERRASRQGESTQPLGTRAIDSTRYSNIYALRPPADPIALDCTSILPHNQCQTSAIQYSGGNYLSGDTKVDITFLRGGLPNRGIQIGDLMYFEFDNNVYNGKYILQRNNNTNIFYINIPGHDLTTGSGRIVRQSEIMFESINMQTFNGSVDINTSKSILGCGVFSSKSQPPYNGPDDINGYGIFGRIRPSYIANLPANGVFSSQDNPLYTLPITPLNNAYNQNSLPVNTIKTSNCWETGYLRVSGVILPAPVVELTDPAPASEAPFSYNGQQYFIGSRCVYGNTSEQRNIAANQRPVSINYRLKNMLTNYVYSSSSVGQGSAISFVNNETSGTVISLFINNNASVFPTYKPDAIRYAENEYFWVHKGGTKNQTITQNSFPPVVIAKMGSISCLSGVAISGYGGLAIGGYIPFNEYPIPIPYYQLPNNTNWTTQQYPPSISGVVQKEIISNSTEAPYSHPGYTNPNQQISIFTDSNFLIDDIIYIQFDTNIPATTLILDSNNYIDGTIRIPFNRSSQPPVNGTAVIRYKNLITDISNNQITIKHKNIPYSIGDSVDIVSGASSTLLNTMPYAHTMNIVSGDATYLWAEFSGPSEINYSSGLSISGVCGIYKNYHEQINVVNITNVREAYWSFSLSGTPSGLYKDYEYKVMSVENTGMPIFTLPSFSPKKYAISQSLYITKPLKIILSQNVIDNGIANNNGVWSLSFNIDGGNRPVYNNFPDIMLNSGMCNFNRQVSPSTMLDTYDATTDTIRVTITNNSNYNWRYDTSFDLLVFDETGSDTKTINFNQTQ